jgi:hypothetical protein
MSIYLYYDTLYYQVEEMILEIQHPTRAMVKSDAMFSHLEKKLREADIKVHRKMCM